MPILMADKMYCAKTTRTYIIEENKMKDVIAAILTPPALAGVCYGLFVVIDIVAHSKYSSQILIGLVWVFLSIIFYALSKV